MQVDNNFRWNACPLCASNDIRFIGNIDYRVPIVFSTLSIDLERTPELYKCESCDSWFTQNIIHKVVAFEMYCQGQSSNKWPRHISFEEEKHKNIIQRLDRFFSKNKRVLDIGCNTGILLDYARAMGCDTAGVEPSLTSRDILSGKGHTAFPSVESVTGKYDVIAAFDLVEHLYDLPSFLKIAANLLVKDGVILILTGNIQSRSAKLSKSNWWYLKAPEHIIFPSRKFLKTAIGFEFVSLDETYASIGYDRSIFLGVAQYIRKSLFFGRYNGLPSLGPDHMLVTLKKVENL
jgi:2-polyprenyl-3-methyl-5-hydroxy-6-metoxy-1,4-benzoquinol methylase